MTQRDMTGNDRALLAELGRLSQLADPVPNQIIDMAKGSFTWRTVEAELAEMVWDSTTSHDSGLLIRSAGEEVRLLTISAEHVTMDLEVLPSGTNRRLVGELTPPKRARVFVETDAGERKEDVTDDLGRFLLSDVPAGRVRLHCAFDDSTTFGLVTTWLDL